LGITSTSPPLSPTRVPQERQEDALAPTEQITDAANRNLAGQMRASRPRYKHTALVLSVLAPVLLGLALLAAWQTIVQMGLVSEFLLPAPAEVLRSFWDSLGDGSLLHYARVTMTESLLGCALGALVALPLGYAIAHSRLVASAVQPYLAASQALPAIAIAPLIALWLGYGLTPVVALCALIVFFPMVITTVLGLRTLDQDVLDAARVEGAGWWALLRHIEFPLALPSILAGVRTSLTLSITGAVVGEFVVGGDGLGELLLVDRSYADTAGVLATLVMLALLAALLYGAVRLVERRFV
jgi:NitT/TauT family transport system permease protein